MNIKEPKPCPLCGASDEFIMIALPEEPGEMGIMCTWCENYISIKGDPDKTTLNDCIDKWNHQVLEAETGLKHSPYFDLNFKRIRELAFKQGWSIMGLCKEIGVSYTSADKWKKGGRVRASTVYKIANALDCGLEDIVESRRSEGSAN